MNALNHHWYETSLLPQAVLKHVAPRDLHPEILFSRSLYIRPILILSRMKKSTAMFHTRIFPILFCITYKKKTSGYGSNWDCSVGLVTGSMLDRSDHSSTPMYKTSSSQSRHIFTLLRSPMLLITHHQHIIRLLYLTVQLKHQQYGTIPNDTVARHVQIKVYNTQIPDFLSAAILDDSFQ